MQAKRFVLLVVSLAMVGSTSGCDAIDSADTELGAKTLIKPKPPAGCDPLQPFTCDDGSVSVEAIPVRISGTSCTDWGDGWLVTGVQFETPKLVLDHSGDTDVVAFEMWSNPGVPDKFFHQFFRNGQVLASVEQTGEAFSNDIAVTRENVLPMVLWMRREVQNALKQTYMSCGIGHTPVSSSGNGTVCRACKIGKYGVVGLVALIGGAIGAAAGSLPGAAAGVGAGAAIGREIAKDAWEDFCRPSCELEKCEEKYQKCREAESGGSSVSGVMRTMGEDPPPQPQDKCWEELIACRHKVWDSL
jgi:hypothetical protein